MGAATNEKVLAGVNWRSEIPLSQVT